MTLAFGVDGIMRLGPDLLTDGHCTWPPILDDMSSIALEHVLTSVVARSGCGKAGIKSMAARCGWLARLRVFSFIGRCWRLVPVLDRGHQIRLLWTHVSCWRVLCVGGSVHVDVEVYRWTWTVLWIGGIAVRE